MTEDRPIWPLSSYGPGKNAPLQLMEGDIEQSPEEMRVRHYLAVAKGNPQESVSCANSKHIDQYSHTAGTTRGPNSSQGQRSYPKNSRRYQWSRQVYCGRQRPASQPPRHGEQGLWCSACPAAKSLRCSCCHRACSIRIRSAIQHRPTRLCLWQAYIRSTSNPVYVWSSVRLW